MRTKNLLLSAAALVAGVLSAQAQSNVYSVNVVGYVNKVLPAGQFGMIANPLNTTNNTVANLIQNPRNGMIIYKWDAGFQANNFLGGVWTDPNATLNPGEGAFVFVPAGVPYTNTFVGEVLQGNLTNALPTGFSLVGSQVPQGGALQTALEYPVSNGTIVYKWNAGFESYNFLGGAWSPSEPIVSVGEGWFSFKPAGQEWVRDFTVE